MSLVRLINFGDRTDARGTLVAFEGERSVPFPIKRVYTVTGVGPEHPRGFHAHKRLEQVAVCLAGSCRFVLDDGRTREEVTLDRPSVGLYVGPMVWREMRFSPGAVLMVLASEAYDEADYVRSYDEFQSRCLQTGRLVGKFVQLRLVSEDDAAFVHGLRTDPRYNGFLSPVGPDIEQQRAWIRAYKEREANGREFYFIIERNDGLPVGTVRVYEITEHAYTWGSLILNEDKPRLAAVEVLLLIHQLGFQFLKRSLARFDVMKQNEHAIRFYNRFGARPSGEDSLKLYYEVTPEIFFAALRDFESQLVKT